MIDEYPSGHPFWLGKPERHELVEDDHLGMLDAFQHGHCFVNGIRNTPCHPDSYFTVLVYEAVDRVMEILNEEFNITPEEWTKFADYWINHTNRQPVTCMLGYHIRSKLGLPSES